MGSISTKIICISGIAPPTFARRLCKWTQISLHVCSHVGNLNYRLSRTRVHMVCPGIWFLLSRLEAELSGRHLGSYYTPFFSTARSVNQKRGFILLNGSVWYLIKNSDEKIKCISKISDIFD